LKLGLDFGCYNYAAPDGASACARTPLRTAFRNKSGQIAKIEVKSVNNSPHEAINPPTDAIFQPAEVIFQLSDPIFRLADAIFQLSEAIS
jgi:hypothetical protein